MANTAKKGGLRLVEAVNGAGAGLEIVLIPAADTHRTGLGDPMQAAAADSAAVGQGPKVASVVQGTATSAIYCVIQSLLPQWSDGTASMTLTQVHRTASVAEYALARVANNADVYEITDDAALAGMASGHLNYNYKLIAADCDTVSGLSNFTIDSANGATTATYPLHVVGPSFDPLNDPASTSASWRVTLNNVVRSGGTGTVGI